MHGEILSFVFAILSNIVWLFVFIPQILENYRNKSGDAISYSLILLWFIGDSLCIVSIQYKEMGNLLWYVNIYHVLFDIIFIIQVLYYRLKDKLNIDLISLEIGESEEYKYLLDDENGDKKLNIYKIVKNVLVQYEVYLLLISIFVINIIQITIDLIHLEKYILNIIGDVFAWISLIIFISSRFPQIILNYNRQNVDGLSSTTFTTIILANNLFLASLLIALLDINDRWGYFINNLQFILSSIGTTVLDIVILIQMLIYKGYNKIEEQEQESQATQTDNNHNYNENVINIDYRNPALIFDYVFDYSKS